MSDEARVILAGPDESSLTRSAYPALTTAGFKVLAVVDTVEKLRHVAAAAQADLIVVEAALALEPDEALGLLSDLGASRLAVILPSAWGGERERFGKLPNLLAGFSAPVNWVSVARELSGRMQSVEEGDALRAGRGGEGETRSRGEEVKLPPPPAPATPVMQPSPASRPSASPERRRMHSRGPAVRLGFHGARGGVGVSTAALQAAQELAEEGQRVALFDETRRGDLHLMVGLRPAEQPVVQGCVTFFLGSPTEERIRDFDAVIVDGGRKRGNFNAEWVAVSKPLSEDQVRRLVGLEPREEEEQEGKGAKVQRSRGEEKQKPRRSLGKLISFEVTD